MSSKKPKATRRRMICGRLEDLCAGTIAHPRHKTREPKHVLEREPHTQPEGDAVVLLARVRHLPQGRAGLREGTPPREAVEVKLRGIYAIDSTTIQLAYWCIDWAKHRQKKDAMAILRSYGIAPPPDSGGVASGMPYLPGFEKMFLKAVG